MNTSDVNAREPQFAMELAKSLIASSLHDARNRGDTTLLRQIMEVTTDIAHAALEDQEANGSNFHFEKWQGLGKLIEQACEASAPYPSMLNERQEMQASALALARRIFPETKNDPEVD
jgi:hypothetical protein